MIAIYPSRPKEPDPAFGWECQWAKKAGFKISFVDLELQLEDTDGVWRTIEINSGGASGVPEGGNVESFYRALGEAIA